MYSQGKDYPRSQFAALSATQAGLLWLNREHGFWNEKLFLYTNCDMTFIQLTKENSERFQYYVEVSLGASVYMQVLLEAINQIAGI